MASKRIRTHSTPSDEVLRRLAQSVVLDVARAPVEGDGAKNLVESTKRFVGLEAHMTSTAESMRRASSHAGTLRKEVDQWMELLRQTPDLTARLNSLMSAVDPHNCPNCGSRGP